MLLMGIDVGTTGAKAIVFDENGNRKGQGFEEYSVDYPRPGRAEQDAEAIWACAKRVIAAAANEAAGGRGQADVAAVSLSVQGDAVLPIDQNRRALAPVQLGMDYRGAAESVELDALFGGRWLFSRTGMRPHPLNSLVKIYWTQKHDPALFDKTWKFVTYADFIIGKLGSDDIVIDHTMAGRTMAMDIGTKTWSPEILGKLGISPEKLGRPEPSGTVCGRLSDPLAAELNVKAGALLVTGGHDQTCAALGAGVIDSSTALDSHGTAEVISTAFAVPRNDDLMYESYYPCYPHTVKDTWFTFALNHTGGILLKWYVENFCGVDRLEAERTGQRLYELALNKDWDGRPSPVIVLPHFNGSGTPTCVTGAKGAILGLTLATTRHDIARAINEALSFELKINLDTMAKAGLPIRELRCVGGGARSPLGLQSKADIAGLPFHTLKIREAACLGAAMLAGMAAGVWNNAREAVTIVKTAESFYPKAENAALYRERVDNYRKIYDTLTVQNAFSGI